MHQTYFYTQKLTYSGLNDLANDISDNTLSHDHTEGPGGTGKKLTASGLEDAASPEIRDYDAHSPFVASGLLPVTSGTLTSNISSGEAYAPEEATTRLVRVVQESATSHTYNADKDTYVYLHPYLDIHGSDDGFFHFEEVDNDDPEPSLPDSSLILAKVVTDGSAITSVINLKIPSPLDMEGLLREVRIYTSNTTWSKPAGLKFVVVEVTGPGAGGGGCALTTGGQLASGKGGGGGGFSRKKIAAGSLGVTETVTVGTGGSGGSVGDNPGSDGGAASSFGSHCTGGLGVGGLGGSARTASVLGLMAWVLSLGSAGGDGTGGDVNITGGRALNFAGGAGAGPYSGQSTAGATQSAGTNGKVYGSGGSGGVIRDADTGTGKAGGSGADGVVIVHEYF